MKRKGFLSLWIRILDKQIQNIWGSGGQSYAFVFDRFFFYMAKGNRLLNFLYWNPVFVDYFATAWALDENLPKAGRHTAISPLSASFSWFVQETAGKREYVAWIGDLDVSIRSHSLQFQAHKEILRSNCDQNLFLLLLMRPTARLKTSLPHLCICSGNSKLSVLIENGSTAKGLTSFLQGFGRNWMSLVLRKPMYFLDYLA